MRILLPIFAALLLLSSCGSSTPNELDDLLSSGDIEIIRKERDRMAREQKELQSRIDRIDSVIRGLEGLGSTPLVTVSSLNPREFNHFVRLQGNVKTRSNVLVYPEYQGVLQRVYVEEGQRVRKGQPLGKIDDGGLSSQLAQLKSQAELARTTYERQRRLWEQKIGSEIQYLQAKTSFESADNAVKQLESQLEKTILRAPFSGIVDDVIKDQGTVVTPGPGSEVFRIVNLSNMYVETEVPEAHLPNVKPGKNVEVYFPVLGKTVKSEVRQTGNFIHPGNRSFTVQVSIPDGESEVKPNLTAEVRINDYSNAQALMVPQSIVSENGQGEKFVYVTERDAELVRSANVPDSISDQFARARRQIIRTGLTQGDYIEVIEGLKAGMTIINEGARLVREGQVVRIIE